MATRPNTSDLAAADITVIAAFDMRDAVQVAALARVLKPSPVQAAKDKLHYLCGEADRLVARYCSFGGCMAFVMNRTVPEGFPAAAELSAILTAERSARAVLSGLQASASLAKVA